jgi:hypothetical protein
MRVMVIVKATEDSERGAMPAGELLAAMGAFNQEMVDAGVLLDGDGLRPSRAGNRLEYDDEGNATVLDGPFAETKEQLGGFYLLSAADLDEALELARAMPLPTAAVEVRPVLFRADA